MQFASNTRSLSQNNQDEMQLLCCMYVRVFIRGAVKGSHCAVASSLSLCHAYKNAHHVVRFSEFSHTQT